MNLPTLKSESEVIDGLTDDDDGSFGDYPIDTLLIRNENRTVHDVLRRIEKGSYVMDPEFQRDFIWPDDKQSKLIESVLMRIPLPVFYLAENSLGQMVVVDGLQRLSTFQRFVNNDLKLRLPKQNELNKKNFEGLSPKLQNRIEDCNLILYVIDAKVPPKALLDIFDRVNSGVPLTRQQMRNCLYSGAATAFLRSESKTGLFLEATGGSLKSETMRDREMINRFCAFSLMGVERYKGEMDSFLADVLKEMNEFAPAVLDSLSARFRRSLKNNFLLFGRHAFRKSGPEDTYRSAFNASLWDAMTIALSRYPEHLVEANAARLRSGYYGLFGYTAFNESITLGTNQLARVEMRFAMVDAMMREVLGDHSN